MSAIAHTTVDTTTYEPFTGFEEVIEGDPNAKVAWLRTESGGEGVLYTGMFTAEPSTFRYRFAGDESFHVLDGNLEISVDGGDTVTLAPGDIASFPKGATSTWVLSTRLRKFFVISG